MTPMDVAGAEVSSARVDDVHVEGLAAGWGLARELTALVRAPRVGEAEAAGAGGEGLPGVTSGEAPNARASPSEDTSHHDVREGDSGAVVRPSANAVNTSANTRHASGRRARAGDIARGGRRARAETSGHGARGGSLRDAHARSSDARRAGPKIGIRWNSAPRARRLNAPSVRDGAAGRRRGGVRIGGVRCGASRGVAPFSSRSESRRASRVGAPRRWRVVLVVVPRKPPLLPGRTIRRAVRARCVRGRRRRRRARATRVRRRGPAVCRLTSPTGAHGVFATRQPPAPRPGSRVSALTLARETHGARVDIGVGPGAGPTAESSPDRARPDQAAPTAAPDANDPPARSPLLHPGGDGGVSFESNHAFGEGACVAQAQILSNLGGFDDATFAARCTLPERNHRRRNENSWASRLRDAAWGTSPRGDRDGDGDGDGTGTGTGTGLRPRRPRLGLHPRRREWTSRRSGRSTWTLSGTEPSSSS